MPKAVLFRQREDGSKGLDYVAVAAPKRPGPGQALVRHTAIGVGFYDIDACRGLRAAPALPFVPGIEACGVVEEAGAGVSFKKGDRVAYCTARYGAYSEFRLIPADLLVGVPDGVPDKIAAAALSKGMTAHMLLCRAFAVKPEHAVFIHAAAGGVGHILCQWAKNIIGAKVYGMVGHEKKEATAVRCGAESVVEGKLDPAEFVRGRTEGKGADVVYDGVGAATFDRSLDIARPFGLVVSYGQSSGPVPERNVRMLDKKCLYLTRPCLHAYKASRRELVLTAIELFNHIEKGKLKILVGGTFKLQDVAKAHEALAARGTVGSLVLEP
jgi:NADPH2:quinone reductase